MSEAELRIPANFMRCRRVSRLAEGPCFADAIAMFWDACSNSAREEQDGIVTLGEAIRMGWHREAAAELVRVGLWGQIDEGFTIVDWPELFPSASGPDESRKARRDSERADAADNLAAKSTNAMSLEQRDSLAAPREARSATVTESRRDSVTFEAWLDDVAATSVTVVTPIPAVRQSASAVTVTRTQLADVTRILHADVPIQEERISAEAGTELAPTDLNLKKEITSSSTPPQQSSIELVAVQTIRPNAVRNDVRKHRRPAARRTAREDHLRLPFDGEASAKPKEESKPQLDDVAAAARGARLIFEATTMQHSPCSPKHKASCEWLASRPESEWTLAKPVLLAEANKLEVRHMLTPQHIADHWPTHYSVGKAPRGRAALERERAALKPVRGFQGLQPLPTLAEYEAEYAKAQAGTLGRLGAATC